MYEFNKYKYDEKQIFKVFRVKEIIGWGKIMIYGSKKYFTLEQAERQYLQTLRHFEFSFSRS